MDSTSDLLTTFLPAELVIDIFSRVLVSNSRRKWTDVSPPHTPLTPFFLGKICRSWRSVAWNNSELWTSLTLTLEREHYEAQVSLLDLWLEKSGTHPLDITIRGPGGDEEEDWELNPPHEIMRKLAAVSERWRSMDMFIPHPCYIDLACMRSRLPLLQNLSIRPPDCVEPLFNHKLDFFSYAPSLTNLSIGGLYFSEAIDMPWAQLQSLLGQDFLADDCYTMLESAPNLRVCRFDVIHQSSDFAYPSSSTISLSHLHTLELSDVGNMLATVFLYSLELPSLASLTLDLGFSFDDWEYFSMSSVTSLIGRSGCAASLQKLSITNLRLVEQELIDCLASAPNLAELGLHVEYPKTPPGMSLSDTFFAVLSPPSTRSVETASVLPFDRPLVPKLRWFEYSGPVNVTGYTVRTLLSYRWNQDTFNAASPSPHAVAKLEHVSIESTSILSFPRSDQAALRELAAAGMDLILTNGYTSWIHDNWVSINEVIRAQHALRKALSTEGMLNGKAREIDLGGEADGEGVWVPNRPSHAHSYSFPLIPPQDRAVGAVLLTRRSQTPGIPPPRRPLSNSTSKPCSIAYST
ncbi:hypothetical protein D9611_014496 [Ephemerocybe angulata]|uniref:F-box domain-containing protein n=1 Tax=Ephemerocybe angulata TaxID=980116 RepID=A0A8H5C375_9AGAR|nr:hypothetical protein D9611_014496 [Tulosesus angulatus]